MKVATLSLLFGAYAMLAMAADTPMKSYLVTYPDRVSSKKYEKAKQDIVNAGGKIQHEFKSIFQGFAALIPDTLDTQMSAWSSDGALIEEDSVVTIQNGDHEMTIDV